MRIETYCPKCDKTTNQDINLEYKDHDSEHNPRFAVSQRCHNCELQREGTILWDRWMIEERELVLWETEQ